MQIKKMLVTGKVAVTVDTDLLFEEGMKAKVVLIEVPDHLVIGH